MDEGYVYIVWTQRDPNECWELEVIFTSWEVAGSHRRMLLEREPTIGVWVETRYVFGDDVNSNELPDCGC